MSPRAIITARTAEPKVLKATSTSLTKPKCLFFKPDPEFALLRYGALVCSSCATYHRKFAISPIKSLFENRLEPEELHVCPPDILAIDY